MMAGENLTLRVRNARDAIAPASEAAETWLRKYRPTAEAVYFVLLAIEELVLNCIKYGYDDDGEHMIEILLSVEDGKLTMVVMDDGHAFDPLSAPPPDLSLNLEERPLGGLGLYLLRGLADHVSYERRNGNNRVTLSKRMQ
jgi:anti-sigma regulatory factor (Ser/Thr protein kinase)